MGYCAYNIGVLNSCIEANVAKIGFQHVSIIMNIQNKGITGQPQGKYDYYGGA